ncbi:hypothetical protein AB0J57_24325 [Streptomyces sp. NPDC049837]|uniref:hypothetical protein n=1 Tax=Streptomyces sp. NPDC049837 TaxID=3155277 RepID=UPI0034193E75
MTENPPPVDITEAPGDPTQPVEVLLEEHPVTSVPDAPAPEPPAPDTPAPETAPVAPVSGGGQEEIA